eukprot:GHVU01039159.1.p2 GENE.GHVU01039159.1~~GHVU01039159.1.p2  ORF type:complete len:105 (-),score=6.01 GHVU01039159.1:948-1262(-)
MLTRRVLSSGPSSSSFLFTPPPSHTRTYTRTTPRFPRKRDRAPLPDPPRIPRLRASTKFAVAGSWKPAPESPGTVPVGGPDDHPSQTVASRPTNITDIERKDEI